MRTIIVLSFTLLVLSVSSCKKSTTPVTSLATKPYYGYFKVGGVTYQPTDYYESAQPSSGVTFECYNRNITSDPNVDFIFSDSLPNDTGTYVITANSGNRTNNYVLININDGMNFYQNREASQNLIVTRRGNDSLTINIPPIWVYGYITSNGDSVLFSANLTYRRN